MERSKKLVWERIEWRTGAPKRVGTWHGEYRGVELVAVFATLDHSHSVTVGSYVASAPTGFSKKTQLAAMRDLLGLVRSRIDRQRHG
jgi:hypothetical protein